MKRILCYVLTLCLALGLYGLALAEGYTLEDFVGSWEGHGGGKNADINLWMTINADGTGHYKFEQSGYEEDRDLTFTLEDQSFVVDQPEDNPLQTTSCTGTYEYDGETLTLHMTVTFESGRVFEYTIPCQRAEAPAADAPAEAADIAFHWRDRDMRVTHALLLEYSESDEEHGKALRALVFVECPDGPATIDDLAAVEEGDMRLWNTDGTEYEWKGFSYLIMSINGNNLTYAREQPNFAFAFIVPLDADLNDLIFESTAGGERIPLSAVPHEEPEK